MTCRAFSQSILVLAASLSLAGCGVANSTRTNPLQATPLPPGNYANWHFQVGPSINAGAPIYLTGPMQISGATVTGLLQTVAVCSQTEPRNFTGTFDSTTGALSLTTGQYGVQGNFTLNSIPTTASAGTLAGGALGYDTGATCLALLGPTPSIAVEIPTLTGTYSGTLTGASTSTTAIAQLTLTQSTTPNTAAGFPLTATLQLAQGSCSNSYALSGQISGAVYSLSGASATSATVSGLDSNSGLTLPNVTVTLPSNPCGTGAVTFVGTLTP